MSEAAITRSRGAEGRRAKQFTMRDARTGRYLTVKEGAHEPLPKEVGRALSMSTNSVAVVIDALRAAVTRSRTAGTPLQFVVEVEPNGKPRIIDPSDAPEQPVAEGQGDLTMDAEEAAELETALDEARTRGRHAVAEVLAGSDMLSADAFAAYLKTNRETVNQRRKAHQLLALQGATRGYRYPVWQVGTDGRPLAALPALFDTLGGDPWEVYRLLAQPHAELDGLTGLEALRRKQDDAVVNLARGVAEGNFA